MQPRRCSSSTGSLSTGSSSTLAGVPSTGTSKQARFASSCQLLPRAFHLALIQGCDCSELGYHRSNYDIIIESYSE